MVSSDRIFLQLRGGALKGYKPGLATPGRLLGMARDHPSAKFDRHLNFPWIFLPLVQRAQHPDERTHFP